MVSDDPKTQGGKREGWSMACSRNERGCPFLINTTLAPLHLVTQSSPRTDIRLKPGFCSAFPAFSISAAATIAEIPIFPNAFGACGAEFCLFGCRGATEPCDVFEFSICLFLLSAGQ